ncbi:MAG TPA: hypothetical protein P5186_06085 [Candidatus Paceibacterota bacterium]|nr:hypothetical protein [Verrucomicrobiota bacterium]HRY47597.1 hypothetical protein [Candidatus Paceibacterota bacterium]
MIKPISTVFPSTLAGVATMAMLFMIHPSSATSRTAEDSFHFRNLSSEPLGDSARQDLYPQLAVAGDAVHLAWLSITPDFASQQLRYRRSTDGGRSFEPARTLLSGSGSEFLYTGLNIHDTETGQTPAYLAADGEQVHIALLTTATGQTPRIVYLRSTDGGNTFSEPRILGIVRTDPPNPIPGTSYTAALRPPMVAASGGRVVIAFGATEARAIDTGVFGWTYGFYADLTILYSTDNGASFKDSLLHGDPPTTRGAALAQLAITGNQVTLAARDNVFAGFGVAMTSIHAGTSSDGGANFEFRQLTEVSESNFADTVRMTKNGANALVFFATEDDSDPPLGTLFYCRSIDNGSTWTAPQRLTEAPAQIANNSSFAVAQNGDEILVATSDISTSMAGRLITCRSADGGASFSPWSTLADVIDPSTTQLTPVSWPRFAVQSGAPAQARVDLLWSGNFLVTSSDSGTSYSPPLMIRPPNNVLPQPSDTAAFLIATADGTLHVTTSSASQTDPNESDVFYRRLSGAPDPVAQNQALTLGANLPPKGDVSAPRHRDSLQIAAAPNLATGHAFTIEFWARFRGELTGCAPFSSASGDLAMGVVDLAGAGQRFQFTLTTDTGTFDATGNAIEALPNTWYHIALRYDASKASKQMSLLINGRLEAEVDASGSRARQVAPLVFGNYWQGAAVDFHGDIDEIRFWDSALPDETIHSRQFTILTGHEPGLAGWFPLDGHTRDQSGLLPDGMLVCREMFGPGAFGSSPAKITIFRHEQALELSWLSATGSVYQLQMTDHLNSDNWIQEGTPIPGNGEVVQVTIPLSRKGSKFLRLTTYQAMP